MEDNKKKIEEFFELALQEIDLKDLLKKKILDGFDSYEDYEKYGDLFPPVDKKDKDK